MIKIDGFTFTMVPLGRSVPNSQLLIITIPDDLLGSGVEKTSNSTTFPSI